MKNEAGVQRDYTHSIFKLDVRTIRNNAHKPWAPGSVSGQTASCFAIDKKGHLLTNAHCVEQANAILVTMLGQTYPAKVIGVDHVCDLALLKIDSDDFKQHVEPLPLGEVDQKHIKVDLIGYGCPTLTEAMSQGVVKSFLMQKTCDLSPTKLLTGLTDALVNQGNSGCPVIAHDTGAVVGVATAIVRNEDIDGITFFMPLQVIHAFLEKAFSPKYTPFPYLEITTQPLFDPNLCKQLGLKRGQSGIRVIKPGAHSDLQVGDVILKADGHTLHANGTISSFPKLTHELAWEYLITRHKVGETLKLEILRDKQQQTHEITLKQTDFNPNLTRVRTKLPRYHIHHALVFLEVNHAYLATQKGEAIEHLSHPTFGDINSWVRKHPKERPVIIADILSTPQTQLYLQNPLTTPLVKSINGRKILGLNSLISVLEKQKGPLNITLMDNTLLCIPKLTARENTQAMLAHAYQLPPSFLAKRESELSYAEKLVQTDEQGLDDGARPGKKRRVPS